jgi:hypothetical protein
MDRYSDRIRRYQEGKTTQAPDPLSDPDRLALDEANADLPLFFDAMLFYLRIQADAYAKIVEYFYKAAKILPGNFVGQLTWFILKHPEFDPEYTSILLANRGWFDRLAGDDGLRDVITHESGILGVAWAKPEGGPIEARTSLYRSSGVVEGNVFAALREITTGWFTFLDEAWRHFVPRLTGAGVLLTMSVNDVEKTCFFDTDQLRGLWVYPIVGWDLDSSI